MSEIVAVLVVPAEGDPGGLLRKGVCSHSSPASVSLVQPTVLQHNWMDGDVDEVPDPEHAPEWRPGLCGPGPISEALPLWWDGALVPEGWDRARRVLCGGDEISYPYTRGIFTPAGPQSVEALGRMLVNSRRASRVVRLTRDASGRLVEVP